MRERPSISSASCRERSASSSGSRLAARLIASSRRICSLPRALSASARSSAAALSAAIACVAASLAPRLSDAPGDGDDRDSEDRDDKGQRSDRNAEVEHPGYSNVHATTSRAPPGARTSGVPFPRESGRPIVPSRGDLIRIGEIAPPQPVAMWRCGTRSMSGRHAGPAWGTDLAGNSRYRPDRGNVSPAHGRVPRPPGLARIDHPPHHESPEFRVEAAGPAVAARRPESTTESTTDEHTG